MGNRQSINSPNSNCFGEEQVYSTLSWAERKTACSLFDRCNNMDDSTNVKETVMEDESRDIVANEARPHSAPKPDPFPSLTDKSSSSEPSEAKIPIRIRNQDGHEVIILHDSPDQLLPESADYYLKSDSSNDFTQGTSGSLDRDARADMVTSRGSVGGREGFDDDSLQSTMERR